MKSLSTIARERALNCEAKKHAYRQTKDGIALTLLLHPQEVPDGLALSPLGTRYLMAMVELADDETPVDTTSHRKQRPKPKVSPDKRLAQQAGALCTKPVFQQFLYEMGESANPCLRSTEEAVRRICEVESRSSIVPGTSAARKWDKLIGQFEMWKAT